MDVLLWVCRNKTIRDRNLGLNPYCIGCTSLRISDMGSKWIFYRLNPYCIGCTSLSIVRDPDGEEQEVLILIVLDVLLWDITHQCFNKQIIVLILIVLDVLLWALWNLPISNSTNVLILIVLDVLLWALNYILEHDSLGS